jgi:glycosyltransferase involved in cell wall biosynthesis
MRVAYDGVPLLGERFGIGYYTEHLIQAVARADGDVRCVVVRPWPVNPFRPPAAVTFEHPGIEVPRPGYAVRFCRRVREKLGTPTPLEALTGDVDIFHATNYLVTHPVRRARCVVSVHDLTVLLWPQWHPARRVREMHAGLRASAEAATRIIAVSETTKADIIKHLDVDPARVAVVPLAVDASFHPMSASQIDTALAPYGLARDAYLLFLGTVEPRKNLGRLLEAVAMLPREVGPLVLAGAMGWGNEPIQPRLDEMARRRRVKPLGYVPRSLRVPLLAGARMLVFPSLYEGFGWPPLEAMACGTPVVTSNVSALPEVVGDAALLIDPLDVDGLAAAIRRLWDDAALRADLRARGLARARGFTWEATARLTLEIYRAALRS